MTSLKDEREDTDGDEMDHESGDSDKTSITSDSSDASDTDDSSEMDEEECERRRNDCIETLTELERQFVTLREQLYRERICQIKTKLEEVHEGIAKEYTEPLEELQDNMRIRIEVAGILKKLRLENIENGFKAEEQAAKQNFEKSILSAEYIYHHENLHDGLSYSADELLLQTRFWMSPSQRRWEHPEMHLEQQLISRNEKNLLFDTLKDELEDKIRRLEEDRNSIDLHNDLFSTDKNRSGKNGRGLWKRGSKNSDSSRRKPVTVTGPYIVYMLSEADILEDWTIIKKALSSSKRNSSDLHI